MTISQAVYSETLEKSLSSAIRSETPYRHWFVSDVFPKAAAEALTV
jgi:hypothetical protein